MTRLPPVALEHLLKTLPPDQENPFPHLQDLTPEQRLQRRVEITGQVKHLEQERQMIDADLQSIFSDSELGLGVRAPGGWMLNQRSRSGWDYPPEMRDAVKALQTQAQKGGTAQRLTSTHLVMIQAST
jgi:hypothetical protein